MLRAKWTTISWVTLALVPFDIAAAFVSAGHVPNRCTAYDDSAHVACAFLLSLGEIAKVVFQFIGENEGFFVGVGTIAIAAFTLALWRSTSALWSQNETNFARLERAYIFVGPFELRLFANKTTVEIRADNNGRTFGIITKAAAYFVDAVPTGAPKYDAQHEIGLDLVVQPNGGTQQGFMPTIQGPSRPQNAEVFVVGFIEYIDVVRTQHSSRFSVRMHRGRIEAVGPPAWNEWD